MECRLHQATSIARGQLQAIADLTGGRAYSPSCAQDLSEVHSEIADDLRVQYVISYASSNTAQGDGWRSILVQVKDHPEAVVLTRKGYAVSHRSQ